MFTTETARRFNAWRDRLQMWWITVAVFAIVIAFADGFVVTSLHGAVGAIERRDTPFHQWLRGSTLMLPLFFLAVLGALVLARRVVGRRGGLVKYGVTALLVTLFASGVAVAELGASSAYDYHLQVRHLQLEDSLHHTHPAAAPAVSTGQPTSGQTTAGACTGLCATERNTFNVHVRAVSHASLLMLLTNFMLVLWVMALRNDRLWRRPMRSAAPQVASHELSLA
jgi:hypothetical protein